MIADSCRIVDRLVWNVLFPSNKILLELLKRSCTDDARRYDWMGSCPLESESHRRNSVLFGYPNEFFHCFESCFVPVCAFVEIGSSEVIRVATSARCFRFEVAMLTEKESTGLRRVNHCTDAFLYAKREQFSFCLSVKQVVAGLDRVEFAEAVFILRPKCFGKLWT